MTAATATSNVGSYAITQGSLAAADPNYALSYVGGTLSVVQRPVTVVATARSRAYGNADPALTYTNTPLGAGAALNGSLATIATVQSAVGGYAIGRGTVTDAANPITR